MFEYIKGVLVDSSPIKISVTHYYMQLPKLGYFIEMGTDFRDDFEKKNQ